ncbi:hypothetical protein [Spiroplasma endosymbiont of Nebria brevicollis]
MKKIKIENNSKPFEKIIQNIKMYKQQGNKVTNLEKEMKDLKTSLI